MHSMHMPQVKSHLVKIHYAFHAWQMPLSHSLRTRNVPEWVCISVRHIPVCLQDEWMHQNGAGSLNRDIWKEVLKRLSVQEQSNAMLVCRQWAKWILEQTSFVSMVPSVTEHVSCLYLKCLTVVSWFIFWYMHLLQLWNRIESSWEISVFKICFLTGKSGPLPCQSTTELYQWLVEWDCKSYRLLGCRTPKA